MRRHKALFFSLCLLFVLLNMGMAEEKRVIKELTVPDSCDVQKMFTNGGHIAYVYTQANQMFLNVNDKIFGPFDDIGNVQWSPDYHLLVYDVRVGDQAFFYVNEKKYGPFQNCYHAGFSSNGKHWAFNVQENQDDEIHPNTLIFDGEKNGPHYWIDVNWAPTNDEYFISYTDMLYKGSVTEKELPIFDKGFDSTEPETVTRPVYETQKYLKFRDQTFGPFHQLYHSYDSGWAPDGQSIYFEAINKTETENVTDHYLFIQGKKLGPFTNAEHIFDSIVWSPDGKNYAFKVESRSQQQGITESKYDIYINEKKYGPYVNVDFLTWSNDSQKCAFVAYETKEESSHCFVIVSDGQKYGPYSHTFPYQSCLEWSEDGLRLAFLVKEDEKCYAVIDGEKIGPFEIVEFMNPAWHKEKKQFTFKARKEGEAEWVLYSDDIPSHSAYQTIWPLWSPDGKRFVYTREIKQPGDDNQKCVEIRTNDYHYALATLPVPSKYDIDQILDRSYYTWSADSRRLAVVVPHDTYGSKRYMLFASGVSSAADPGYQQIPHVLESELPITPVWSPDSTKLAFVAKLALGWELPYIDQKRYTPLKDGSSFGRYLWRWTPDSKALYHELIMTPDGQHRSVIIMNDQMYCGCVIDNSMIFMDGNKIKLQQLPENQVTEIYSDTYWKRNDFGGY